MAKKLSFNDLPSAVEKVLEILSSASSEHAALPELVMRMTQLEKKIEYLQLTISPDKPVMDMRTVCKVLKLKPKAVYELAESGILPSREQGRKTVFYEEGVLKFFATQPAWKAAVTESKTVSTTDAVDDRVPEKITIEGRKRIDINTASVILDRSTAAIYQLISNDRVPHHKDGSKVYFFSDELREWAKDNPPRKRRRKTETP